MHIANSCSIQQIQSPDQQIQQEMDAAIAEIMKNPPVMVTTSILEGKVSAE